MADLDTHVVTVDAHGPVGDSIGVDLASEDANAGAVLNMRSNRDGTSLRKDFLSRKSSCSGSKNAHNGGDEELHIVCCFLCG